VLTAGTGDAGRASVGDEGLALLMIFFKSQLYCHAVLENYSRTDI